MVPFILFHFRCDSTKKLQSKLKSLKSLINDPVIFKKMYRYAFDFCRVQYVIIKIRSCSFCVCSVTFSCHCYKFYLVFFYLHNPKLDLSYLKTRYKIVVIFGVCFVLYFIIKLRYICGERIYMFVFL